MLVVFLVHWILAQKCHKAVGLCFATEKLIVFAVSGREDHETRHDHDIHLLCFLRYVQRTQLSVTGEAERDNVFKLESLSRLTELFAMFSTLRKLHLKKNYCIFLFFTCWNLVWSCHGYFSNFNVVLHYTLCKAN